MEVYINKAELLKELSVIQDRPVHSAIQIIKILPTIDIVRCGECEYADEYNHCKYSAWWNGNADFCSHGIRRKESR